MDPHEHVFSENDRVIVGSLYLGLSAIIFPIHILFLTLFIIYDDFRKNIVYNIMLSIGITECLQLIGHIYAGIATLTDNNDYDFIEELAGNITNATWIALIPQTFILSLNRYTVFRRHKSCHKKLFLSLIAFCWIYGLAFFIIYSTPLTGLIYMERCFCWAYNDGPWSIIVGSIEFYSLAPTLLLTFFVHLSIVINIAYTRTTLTSNKKIYDKNEFKILFQSFVMFFYPAIMLSCWHFAEKIISPPSPWISVAINLLWIIYCGLNPILYFSMNKQIRCRFLQLLRLKKIEFDDIIIIPKSFSEPQNVSSQRIISVF